MTRCPSCGAEVDAHMTQCWECQEPIDAAASKQDDDGFDDDDDLLDLDDNGGGTATPVLEKKPAVTDHLEDAADALLAADEPSGEDILADTDAETEAHVVDESEIPESAVVAYVAQDEVQAGTISQLLTDCGIQNFATSAGDEDNEEASAVLQVQVLQEDLAAAQQLIQDFTAEFDDFS